MTDFKKPINWGASGPWLCAPIQLLNSIGALTMVYAFRHGKVIIVSPMINALAPVITIVLSLLLYRVIPHRVVVAGMALGRGGLLPDGLRLPKGLSSVATITVGKTMRGWK
jgi:hypothetical protein